jgi:hypothetical protein
MKPRLALLLLLVCLSAAKAAPIKVAARGLTTFRGAWFDIKYPIGFKPVVRDRPLSGSGDAGSCDGASFLSPDGLVEFYVYSPQWRGQSQWLFKRQGEKRVAQSTQPGKTTSITYMTFTGPGYTRTYADYKSNDGATRWGLGIKYKSQAAYNAYRPLYLKFKQSLKQYADGATDEE